MKKVSIIGHFAYGLDYLDGQTVKTKIVANELLKTLGENSVMKFDTHGAIKTLIKAPLYAFQSLRCSENVVIMPAHNGLIVFSRILPIIRTFYRNRRIYYIVIGGWLPNVVRSRKGVAKALKKFDGIFVETSTMKESLESLGLNNLFVLPNCKELTPVLPNELIYQSRAPFSLCTFSRVMKEKGIDDAVKAVKAVNDRTGKTIYTLDIFGQVDKDQLDWFQALKTGFPEYIHYKGAVPFDQSVPVLKNYYALLFPTHFYTEGIPGTILDAYAAGIPIISAVWQNYSDIIMEKATGIGYEFNNVEDLICKLMYISEFSEEWNSYKKNCLEKSKDYTPAKALKVLYKEFVATSRQN